MRQEPVVIIGAGPAGLSAAYECMKRGIRPIVVEKADRVGGIARTETYKGYHFDIGGHRFFSKNQKINQLWQEMLGEDFLRVHRMSSIYYQGRFFNYPLDFFNASFNLGVMESVLILLSYFRAQCWPHPEEVTFEQWVSNRFGRRLYEAFFKTYTEKVWGIPCRRIRADWAAQRIKGLSLIVAVSNALLGVQQAKSLVSEFYYPRKGPGMMWERFREAVEAGGGQVRRNWEAISLKHENGRIASIICIQGGKTEEIPVGHLISSMPISRLVAMLEPKVTDKALEAARGLSYRAFIIVVLIVDKEDLFPDQWIYIHSPDVRVGRIQNFKNWSAAMVPDPKRTSVGMEYFCNEGDATWTMSDTELLDLAARELSELGLAKTHDVIDGLVVRQPKAYPIYNYEYEKHLEVIRDFLKTIDNLQTIGRNGMHRYNNMDHSMYTGMLAVENILGAEHDMWEVNEEEVYLEEDKQAKVGRLVPEKVLARTFARMDKLAFATAVGSVSGLLLFIATVWLIMKGGVVVGPNLRLLGHYFIGYTVTVKGAFIAFGYSFIWGFLFGWLLAYLRNLVLAVFIYGVKRKAELLSLKDFFDHL
jgi:protoporphyrinogen oxidase